MARQQRRYKKLTVIPEPKTFRELKKGKIGRLHSCLFHLKEVILKKEKNEFKVSIDLDFKNKDI